MIGRRTLLRRLSAALLAPLGLLGPRPRGIRAESRMLDRSVPSSATGAPPGPRLIQLWPENFEAAIAFTFGDPGGGMANRRPYVAIYIEDSTGTTIRTIGLWAQPNATWLREMRRWWRGESQRRSERGIEGITANTSATRPPGRYTVVWDGRDEWGELVEQGSYAICLETIRQGGLNYFVRKEFTFGDAPFESEIEDYATFREIRVEYRERN